MTGLPSTSSLCRRHYMERQAIDTRPSSVYTRHLFCLCAAVNWTLLAAGIRTLDAFHRKCLSQLLGIRWYNRVRNDEVLHGTGVTSLSHLLYCRHTSPFGHVTRLVSLTTTYRQTRLFGFVTTHPPADLLTVRATWCRPQNKWLDQLRDYSVRPVGDLWGELSAADTVVQRRDGPHRLRDHDDDDTIVCGIQKCSS